MPRLERPSSGLLAILKGYRGSLALLVFLTVGASALGLFVPQVIAQAIDAFTAGSRDLTSFLITLTALTLGAFIFGNLQSIAQTVASERVARDLRARLVEKIAQQSYASIEAMTPAQLLTNLTSDIDAIKTFVAQAVALLISSAFALVGASALLLWLNWQLALAVLTITPFIAATLFLVTRRVRTLFGRLQGTIDTLNETLHENIVGAALIRLLNAQRREFGRFLDVNGQARAISMQILHHFAAMIPIITFLSNLATLTILVLGGHFVISGRMSLGEFMAFNAYLAILVFPILIISFASSMIGQAQASYARLMLVLNTPSRPASGEAFDLLSGDIEVRDVGLAYGTYQVLDHVSFRINQRSRTAIIGPTAAGKSQLLYVMAGLIEPTSGSVLYDGKPVGHFARECLYAQIAFVFQDSHLFNLSIRENIAFNAKVDDAQLSRALETAELSSFIATLPQGLDTIVSERGASLSGGQKQRIILARALALNPKILFLDDFTARVDIATESRILTNIRHNYPDLTLVSITQKIAPVEDYDQIVLLMEGEKLAAGTHDELVHSSPEYVQILRSQQSTDTNEAA